MSAIELMNFSSEIGLKVFGSCSVLTHLTELSDSIVVDVQRLIKVFIYRKLFY